MKIADDARVTRRTSRNVLHFLPRRRERPWCAQFSL